MNQAENLNDTDEVWSTLLAAGGALLSIGGIAWLLVAAAEAHQPWQIVAFTIYGIGLISMFVTSALHHGVRGSERTAHILHQLDYYAISIMIAGTFTPFCLVLLRSTIGWSFFAIIWSLAIVGIALKARIPHVPTWITTALFLLMGWLGVVIAYHVYLTLGLGGLMGLIIGGLFYTVGAMFFHFEKPNFWPGKFAHHELWHVFVLGGAASHFIVMFRYILPYTA